MCPKAEFDSYLSGLHPPDQTASNTSQDATGLLNLLGTAGSCSASVNQHHQLLFHWESFQPLLLQPVVLHMVIVTQGQDPALHLVDSHTIGLRLLIQLVQFLLQSLPTPLQINSPAQLDIISKLSESALNPSLKEEIHASGREKKIIIPSLNFIFKFPVRCIHAFYL